MNQKLCKTIPSFVILQSPLRLKDDNAESGSKGKVVTVLRSKAVKAKASVATQQQVEI